MILHVVLFQPRADLTADARGRFREALSTALASIPSIRRARVGRRVRHGAGYEVAVPVDFEYIGVLEVDDLTALRSYLDHPAHAALGALFHTSNAAALAYDYDVPDTDPVTTLTSWSTQG